MPKRMKYPDTVSGACPAETNDRLQQLLGPGETRSSFVRDAIMSAIEQREKSFNCHEFERDGERRGYYCANCGQLRMHHLAGDVRRAHDSNPRSQADKLAEVNRMLDEASR